MNLLVAILPLLTSNAQIKPIHLFDGKSLDGWKADVPERDARPELPFPFLVREKSLVILGQPMGHLVTDASFENYKLVVEYRWPKTPGNSGVVVHVSKLRHLRDFLPQGIEVQLRSGDAGNFHLFGETLFKPEDATARAGRRLHDNIESPAGEWNTMEIECNENEIKVKVNGKFANHGKGGSVKKGQIALQSEGAEIEFRKIELTKLNP